VSLFDFEPEVSTSRSPKVLVAAILAAGALLSTTLAANISIGTGDSIEFGQGIQVSTACSGNTALTIKPELTFVNSSGAGDYYFSGYTISNIPNSCQGVDLSINAYGETSSAMLPLFNSNASTSMVYNNAGTYELNGSVIAGQSITTNSTSSYSVNFTTPVAMSKNVARLTIQSVPHKGYCASGANCVLGDIGPGGGTIFYVSQTPFTETGTACASNCRYLEAAPANWYSGSGDPSLPWWLDSDFTFNPNANSLGNGYSNTSTIIARRNATVDANSSSWDYAGGGKTDWFLPSLDELSLLSANRNLVPGLQNGDYWSSSQNQWYLARFITMSTGTASWIHRYNNKFVRPIRAF
jgi:hypothetical protein